MNMPDSWLNVPANAASSGDDDDQGKARWNALYRKIEIRVVDGYNLNPTSYRNR